MALGKKTGGRKKGTPNKTTAALKDAILIAAEEALPGGKVGYLKWLAKNNSSAFAGLLGKVLPTTIAGDPANPVRHEVDLSIYSDADLETMIRILGHGKTNVRDLPDTRRDKPRSPVAARSMKGPLRADSGHCPPKNQGLLRGL